MDTMEKEFGNWWNDLKIESVTMRLPHHLKSFDYKNIIDSSSLVKGTYCNVFKRYYQEDHTVIAIKYTSFHNKEKLIALWQEYKIHKKIYDSYIEENLEPKVIQPLWIKKIALNNGLHSPFLAIGLERIEETVYDYLLKNKGDNSQSRKWKEDIIQELKRLREKYKFYHRDCHINNVGIVQNTWKIFDFGMAIFKDVMPYIGNGSNVNFYWNNSLPSNIFDERILRFSWNEYGDNDDWVTYELKKIAKSSPKYWTEGMFVVVKNHPLTKNGKFSFITEKGNIVILLEIPGKKEKTLNLKTAPSAEYESTLTGYTLECEFKKEDVLPDITQTFIHYYLPLLP